MADNIQLHRGRLLALKRHSQSHCDRCGMELDPMRDVLQKVSEFKIRCCRCALAEIDREQPLRQAGS